MKKVFLSIGVSILVFTGCATDYLGINDAIQNTKLVTMTPNVPQIRKKYSIAEYKNKNFDVVLKDIYANPIQKYSSVYIVDCRTISKDNNLTEADYLCHNVEIDGKWQWRPQWIQDNINKKIKKLFSNAEEELNKFCIAKGGYVIANKKFYDENGKLKDMRDACIVNNKVYFAFAEKNEYSNNKGLQIWSPEYFKIKNMNFDQKISALKKFLLKHNAKKINSNQFDLSNYNGYIFYSIKKFFPGVYTLDGSGINKFNTHKPYEYYYQLGTFLCKRVDNRLYQSWIKNNHSNETPLIYLDKNGFPIAILLYKEIVHSTYTDKKPYILFILDSKTSIHLKNEFDVLKAPKIFNRVNKEKENNQEIINY